MDLTRRKNTLKVVFDLCNNLLDLILSPMDLDEILSIDYVPSIFNVN